jgi:hypothetical protein
MCNFASAVITRDKEFYLMTSDSHYAIISCFNLNEFSDVTGVHIVKVEITPDTFMKTWPSLATWNYLVDQDVLPAWHLADKGDTKKRAFEALARRAKKGFGTVDLDGLVHLKTLSLPKTRSVNVKNSWELGRISAPRAKELDLSDLPKLKTLVSTQATDVTVSGCPKLTRLVVPKAEGDLNVSWNVGLKYVSAGQADDIDVMGCRKLQKLYAPNAKDIWATGTPKYLVIKAKKGARIHRGHHSTVVK